jgi:hypothetical protein
LYSLKVFGRKTYLKKDVVIIKNENVVAFGEKKYILTENAVLYYWGAGNPTRRLRVQMNLWDKPNEVCAGINEILVNKTRR